MQPFPLLRLPFVALTDALQCFDPIQLFNLSQCSAKMVSKVKLAKTQKFQLSIDFEDHQIAINDRYIFDIRDSDCSDLDFFQMNGHRNFEFKDMKMIVPVAIDFDYEDNFPSFWNDVFVGMRTVCCHLIHIFGCKVVSFKTENRISAENFQLLIGDILEKQDNIPNLAIGIHYLTDDVLKWTLDTVKVTEKLEVDIEVSEDFTYNFNTLPEVLTICPSYWLTLNNLLSLNLCKVIELNHSLLSFQELDIFMKLWKNGSYPKLVYLHVDGYQLDEIVPIVGLTKLRNTMNPTIRQKRIYDKVYKIFNGVDIQGHGGIMATIEVDVEYECFELLVWAE